MLRKPTLIRSKTENLFRLAKYLKLNVKGLNHRAVAEQIYFYLLYS